jgi:transposase
MTRKIEIVRHVSKEELERLYKREMNVRVKERLHAILLLYDGMEGKKAAKILHRGYASIRRWKDAWNAEGSHGLIPEHGGGPTPRVPDSAWDRILKEIEGRAMTLQDVRVYVNAKYEAEYSYNSVWYWVRKKKKVAYGKPYPRDVRRPVNAEEVLKKPS